MTSPLQQLKIPGGKPLYLLSYQAKRVSIDSTRRLQVHMSGGKINSVPLHLVSRLVCGVHIEIETKALHACMHAGVPIAIQTKDSESVGWCFGARRVESSLRQLLLFAYDDPKWEELYETWRDQTYDAIASQALLLCDVPATLDARKQPRIALCNAHFEKHGVACGDHLDALTLLAVHEIAAVLAEEVGDASLVVWGKQGLNLVEELGALVAVHAHVDLHHAQGLRRLRNIERWAVPFYESMAAHWQQRIATVVVSFEQFLRSHWL